MDAGADLALFLTPYYTPLVQPASREHGRHLVQPTTRAVASTMERSGRFCTLVRRLHDAGLRPTKQRLGLSRLLFGREHRHVAAEQLHSEARAAGLRVSLATVYNTLHQFTAAGLLRRVVVNTGQTFFDTNTCDHHHFFEDQRGEVRDVVEGEVAFARLPAAPEGYEVIGVEVIVHLRARPRAQRR